MPKRVRDMEFDEVSTVDLPANQHGVIVLAKRASQEDTVADYFDADGNAVDIDDLEIGDVVADAEGNLYEIGVGDDNELDNQEELELVGKSAELPAARGELSKSALQTLSEQLSKAVNDGDREELYKSALAELAKRADDAEARTFQLMEIAKGEHDLRLEREYIAKAAEYNVPIAAEELGPVLKRCAESLSDEDCSVLHKALTAAGEMLYSEAGFDGQAANDDPFAVVDAFIDGELAKRDGGSQVSKEQAIGSFFDDNPRAYDQYRAARGR